MERTKDKSQKFTGHSHLLISPPRLAFNSLALLSGKGYYNILDIVCTEYGKIKRRIESIFYHLSRRDRSEMNKV